MGNQKIKRLIKKILISFLFFGIPTMNYAENFYIKHEYTQVFKTFDPPASIWYDKIAISNDDHIITDRLSDISKIESDIFGIYKIPLTAEMKKRMVEINRLLRLPHIEKVLATSNKERDFIYVLDMKNNEMKQVEMIKMISGFDVTRDWNLEEFLKYGTPSQAKNNEKINQFVTDLIDNGISKNKVKFADFYGITNIIPKDYGLLVVLTLKNVGPFDVTLSNPKEWQDILKDEFYEKYEKKWYELNIGGLYKGEGCWMRFTLLPKYLIKEDLSQEELSGDSLKINSNSERVIRFLIPYKDIMVKLNNGEVDTNRTKDGYIHLDNNAAIILSNWNLDINFGGVFSDRTWKEEKSSQVKGWVNLE